MNTDTLAAKLAQVPAVRELADKWTEAGASQIFVKGAVLQLARMAVGLREHDRRFGTDTETRKRRSATAARMRTLAKFLNRDPDATNLTIEGIVAVGRDSGRISWLTTAVANRPNVSRVLTDGAELLETARGFGTVHLTRDTIAGVASILQERHRIIESVTGKRLAWRARNKDVAAIAAALIGKQINTATVRKVLQRSRSGTK